MKSPLDLRAAIARDLKPTRPLLPPATRALVLAPIALATMIAVPGLYFFRSDFAQLGLLRSWGLSIGESIAGLVMISLALRESIPGRSLSSGSLAAAFAGGLALPFAIAWVTSGNFSIGAASDWNDGIACFRTSSSAAVPAMIAVAVLVARAFPLRPGVAGALYGLGCGLIADAGLRLYCEFTLPAHLIGAHGGAVLAATGAGSIVARILRR